MFKKGEVADLFVDALAERARAGVRVTVVMDAVGAALRVIDTLEVSLNVHLIGGCLLLALGFFFLYLRFTLPWPAAIASHHEPKR